MKPKRQRSNKRQAGIALVTALIFLMVVVVLLSIASISAISNRKSASDSVQTTGAQLAAEAGLESATDKVWFQIWSNAGISNSFQKTVSRYQTEIQKIGLTPGNTIYSNNNRPTVLGTSGNPSQYLYSIQRLTTDPTTGKIVSPDQVLLAVKSTGTFANDPRGNNKTTRVLSQTFRISNGIFPWDYALLSNNLNCIFCHADIQNIAALKGAATASNPWQRAKVGSLESLVTRGTAGGDFDTDTTVQGSVQTRGTVGTWTQIGTTASSMRSTLQPGQQLITDSSGAATVTPQDCSTPANCKTIQNFYYNYPKNDSTSLAPFGGQAPDGTLPDAFPLPVADTNGNRQIDNSEWSQAISDAAAGNRLGTLTGGSIKSPGSGSVTWGGGSSVSISGGSYTGNLILDGSQTPIELNGTVFVNGDVVIRGKVRGTGTLIARGNVDILGDLTYDCGTGSSTAACDYTKPETLPSLSWVAGGNVLAGDYLAPTKYFSGYTKDGKPQYNALNTTQVDPLLKNCPGTRDCGPAGVWNGFANMEIGHFNRAELYKFLTGQVAVPRFYRRNSSDQIYFNNGCESGQDYHSNYIQIDSILSNNGKGKDVDGNTQSVGSVKACESGAANASLNLSPSQIATLQQALTVPYNLTNDWIQETNIRALWNASRGNNLVGGNGTCYAGSNARGSGQSNTCFRIDGLMYSSNAIFSIARRGDITNTNGRVDIRGSVVAADTGILAPGSGNSDRGIEIYHDPRLRPDINLDPRAILSRSLWRVTYK